MVTALAEAEAAAKQDKLFTETLRRGLDLGAELFNEDIAAHPGEIAYNAEGFDDLLKLAEVGGQYETLPTLDFIRQIKNDVLKAHLLIGASEGVAKVGPAPAK